MDRTFQVEKIYTEYSSIEDIIDEKIASNFQERSFYVVDMYDIYKKHLKWLQLMPRIKPFYAVKCNNMPEILNLLANLGIGFDCASKGEIMQVLNCGVSPDRIIYANPCKTKYFIKHANSVKVNLMTFDNEMELHKVAQLHPQAKLVLRIKGDDRTSRCKFNIKFGADLDNCYHLLKVAKQLDLNVVGVSFHNGSDCQDPEAYNRIIGNCKLVFEMGEEIGHKMDLLDVGGGFPGDDRAKISFEDLALAINQALEEHFPSDSSDVEIIAEPGRYYVASALTLATMIIAKRVEFDEKTKKDGYIYYMNDGIYGAFNNVIYEHATPEPELLNNDKKANNNNKHQQVLSNLTNNLNNHEKKLCGTVLWGPTCDSIDCVKRDFLFPEMNIGDWLLFKNMGAYTCCVATEFNGFDRATIIIADNITQQLELMKLKQQQQQLIQ